jgi:hypothetical protein
MRTITQAALLLAMATALAAQAPPPDVLFTAPVPPPPGAAGARTFAFVAGELVGNPVKGAPYSADALTETTQTLADGNRIVNRMSATVYRDSEGRQRREQSLPAIGPFTAQGAPPRTIFISDPVAGVNYSLDSNRHVAMKMPAPPTPPLPPPPPGAQTAVNMVYSRVGSGSPGTPGPVMIFRGGIAPGANPPNVEQLGSKIIEGVQAEGTRSTITIPAGQIGNDRPLEIVDETWRSPELQVIVQSSHSDPRTGTTLYTLKNINRSEPSPTLFQVPADYTVQDSPAIQFEKRLPPPQ